MSLLLGKFEVIKATFNGLLSPRWFNISLKGGMKRELTLVNYFDLPGFDSIKNSVDLVALKVTH